MESSKMVEGSSFFSAREDSFKLETESGRRPKIPDDSKLEVAFMVSSVAADEEKERGKRDEEKENMASSKMAEGSSHLSVREDSFKLESSSKMAETKKVKLIFVKLKVAFLVSSVAAVWLDALFFYIYFIDEENKCFALDMKIKKAAIISRSLTDTILLLQIVFQILSSTLVTEPCASSSEMDLPNGIPAPFRRVLDVNKRIPWRKVLIDFLALLPIPQTILLLLFANMKSTKHLENRWQLNVLPLLQYVPRVIRIYMLCKELSRSAAPNDITGASWVKGAFNIFLFILASHVVGAVWYLFSVERELFCWQHACKFHSECRAKSFFCDDITGHERFVDKFCPINPPDSAVFDFGIFLYAHLSGVSRLTNFPEKLFFCFSWGLRTLSSFGSNLETSTYVCENILAVLVTIAGILLVVYLIGNLQTYLQLSTSRSEERRRMMQSKVVEIDSWVDAYEVQDKKDDIMQFVRDKFDGNNDVNLKTMLAIFPASFAGDIKKRLCSKALKEAMEQHNVRENMIEEMMRNQKPVVFAEHSHIVREGEAVDQMLLFMRGDGLAYNSTGGQIGVLRRGMVFGGQLLDWAAESRPVTKIPLSEATLKSQTKMEAFALMAADLLPY